MNKTWRWIIGILSLLLVVALIISCVRFSGFLEPGVHFLGRYVHVELSRKCWIRDEGTVTDPVNFTEESTLTISGYLKDSRGSESTRFDGHAEVADYPISFKNNFGALHGTSGSPKGNCIQITNHGASSTNPDVDTHYIIHIMKDNPEVIVCMIISLTDENAPAKIAVCGDTREEAEANYKYYLEHVG